MKRYFIILLTVLILCGLLAGCGGEEKPVSTQKQQETAGITETVNVTETIASEQKTEITIAETVVYDSNNVRITAVEIEESWSGVGIKLLVENNTEHNIALSGSDIIINGVTMHGGLYIDVAAGMKAYGTLDLYEDALNTAGIEQIAVIEAKDAYIYDTDSYETLAQAPLEIVTSIGYEYEQSLDESGDVLFESNGITVIAKVISEEFYGNTVLLYVKNESEKNVVVEAENISVNGFTIDAWMYDNVYAGTVRFCDLDLLSSGLEESGIEEIENVSFTISIIDPDSYTTLAVSDTIQIFVTE